VSALRGVDRVLAPLTWLAAAFAVLVLLAGPSLIGAKKAPGPAAAAASGPADGQAVFSASCAGCHTLKAAGAAGTVGPDLDTAGVDAATVESTVRSGSGVMPSFQGQLSDAEIKAVADYVASSAGG
jgi:sulfite dehydrogenase